MEISVLPHELHASCRPVCLLVQQVTLGNTYVCLCYSLYEHRIYWERQCRQGDEFYRF